MVFNAGTLNFYIDGQTAAFSIYSGSIPSSLSSDNKDLTIGRRDTLYWDGKIDEVAIFDTALNADQIKFDLYQPSLPAGSNKTADIAKNPNLPNPVAWYRMGD